MDLHIPFVDLTKTCSIVSSDGPENNSKIGLYSHCTACRQVFRITKYSEPFPVTNGDKQSCAMTPTLFSMMFAVMLTNALQDCDTDFPIIYGFDGKLFNLRRMQDKSKVQPDVLDVKNPS